MSICLLPNRFRREDYPVKFSSFASTIGEMTSSPPPPPTGILYRVDGESLNALIEKYEKSLSTNAEETQRQDKLRQEYLTLKSRISTLPQKLEYNALVPLGRRALCPGKIIHTNEITCLLGDNWYVECSAEKAVEIVNHRIAKLDEQRESLRKERELINNWKQEAERQLVETIGEGTVEIREDYDEEYERHWKEEHREKVRRFHQQKAKERFEAQQEKHETDQDLWLRLDELEIQEELENYLGQDNVIDDQVDKLSSLLAQTDQPLNRNAKVTNHDDAISVSLPVSNSEATSDVSPDEKTDILPVNPPATGKRVKFSTDNIVHNISEDRSFSNQETYNQEKPSHLNVPAGFTDDNTLSSYPCFEPIMIRFRHSSRSEMEDDENGNASETEEEDNKYQIVSSPGEIVKVFGPTSISAISNKPSPKSILKPFAPPLVSEKRSKKAQLKVSAKKNSKLSSYEDDDVDIDDIEVSSAISKVVTERVPVFTALQLNTQELTVNSEAETTNVSKPVSLFKMRRQQQQSAGAVVASPE